MMKKRAITFLHHVKTRIHLVHLGFQHSRNCMRQYRYFSRMACDLAPQCNILYGFLQCQLSEDTIDIEIMMRTMKGILTFKKVCGNQTSSCTPWGLQVYPFPSLVKKVEPYLEERRNITNPFCLTHTYPDRPITSPFARLQTPERKKTKNSKKRSRKVNHKASRKQYKVR